MVVGGGLLGLGDKNTVIWLCGCGGFKDLGRGEWGGGGGPGSTPAHWARA